MSMETNAHVEHLSDLCVNYQRHESIKRPWQWYPNPAVGRKRNVKRFVLQQRHLDHSIIRAAALLQFLY